MSHPSSSRFSSSALPSSSSRSTVQDPNINPRRIVQVLEERVGAVSSDDFPGHRFGKGGGGGGFGEGGEGDQLGNGAGGEGEWDVGGFRRSLSLLINSLTPTTISFDLIGIDASVANTLRRCMISEVPTIAIEKVYFYNNTSIMHDEVFAHRLGLVPLKIDPRKMTYRSFDKDAEDTTDENTLVFTLVLKCESNPSAPRDSTNPLEIYLNSSVYSSSLEWVPSGNQAKRWKVPKNMDGSLAADGSEKGFKEENRPRVAVKDILLTKLRPGQEINAVLHCQKGTGKIHAKWSPVATASYRLLPHIQIKKDHPIPPTLAKKFQNCFPEGVIELEYDPITDEDTKVVVANPRLDTVSREVLRHDEFKDIVTLGRVRDHFIFSVESTGAYPPEDLLPEAIGIMQAKLSAVEESLMKQFSKHAPPARMTE